jgi:hypothetical protein
MMTCSIIEKGSARLAESGQIAATANQRDNATGSLSSVEEVSGRDDEDSKPPLVATSSPRIGSSPSQEVVLEEGTPDQIPSDWTRIKPEPDC